MGSKTIFVKHKKRKKHYLVLLLLPVIGAYFYLDSSPKKEEELTSQEVRKPRQKTKLPPAQKNVKKIRLRDIKNQENSNHSLTPSKPSASFPIRDGVNLEQERQFDEILQLMKSQESDEDIESIVKKYQLIERKIKEPLEEELDEDSREMFIQQFLQNARDGGYEVQLSEDLKVISIRKIRRY